MKLRNLIPETVEGSIHLNPDQLIEWLTECSRMCSKLGSRPVLWRGFGGSKFGFTKVSGLQGRENYRGGSANAKKIIQFLNKKFGTKGLPTFTTFEQKKASFWGNAYIFIPTNPFVVLQHKDVNDLLTYSEELADQTGNNPVENHVAEWVADNYQKTLSPVNSWEALFFVDTYYLLTIDRWLYGWFPRKLQRPVKTYSDLKDVLEKWIWLVKQKQKI